MVLIRIHISLRSKIIIILVILLIPLLIVIGNKIYYKYIFEDYYKIISRDKKIADSKKNDELDHKTIGWIKIQNTNVDTAVYELDTSSTDELNIKGRDYSWVPYNHSKLLNKETVIGHNILNLSSIPGEKKTEYEGFEDLMSFVYYDVAKESKYIQYTFNGKTYLYKIFSVMFQDTDNLLEYESSFDLSKIKLKNAIKYYKENSIYDYNIDVNDKDKILTLDTCTRFYGYGTDVTFSVNARLVRENERIDNYKVTINKNYKKIENKMKGEKENEEKENI